jgi:hypothetical protein
MLNARSRYDEAEIQRTHNSGLFCVSMTAAIGIPKLEAGPQKSTHGQPCSQFQFPLSVLNSYSGEPRKRDPTSQEAGNIERTRRAEIAQHGALANLRIDFSEPGRHCESVVG